MDIFDSQKLADLKKLTPLQLENLKSQNIDTLAQLLQIIPRKLDLISSWTSSLEPNQKYKNTFLVQNLIHKKSSRGLPYISLQLESEHKVYQAFLFSRANFLLNKLRVGQSVELIVSIFGNVGFGQPNLVIQKVIFGDKNTSLGHLNESNIDLFYPKMGAKIDTALLRRIHQRLNLKDYVLDLSGLVPESLLNSHSLDLYPLHHPKTQTEFFNTLNQLQTVKVFLKTSLEKFIVYTTTKNSVALKPRLHLEWLQESVKKLPVVLTASQKGAIWEILQDVTITK
jgi:RecG-like helicase